MPSRAEGMMGHIRTRNQRKMKMDELTIDQATLDTLLEWTYEGSHFAGMSYEDGIRAMIELLQGDCTAAEVMGEA